MEKKLPNFFIVGAPKAGTTSLYHYLKGHPEVFMSAIKEPNFFSYDETVKQNLYHKEKGVGTFERYKNLFATANGHHRAIGEASVSYLFYPGVAERIHQVVPEARIIISLRNPVDRAYSHYFMEHKLGYVNASMEDIVFKKTKHRFAHLWYQQFVELGLYYEQVKRYLDTFGEDRVAIFIYEEIAQDMEASILHLLHFLKLDTAHLPEVEGKFNTYSTPRNKFFHFLYSQKQLRTIARNLFPSERVEAIKNIFLTREKKFERKPETEAALREIYKPDIKKLEQLLNKNLSFWYE